MKNRAVLVVFLLLCASLCWGQSYMGPDADVAAIRALCAQWTKLYNAGSFRELVGMTYTEDAVLMSPDQPIRQGREAILGVYEKARASDEERCDSSVVEDIRVSGDLAVARGTDTGITRSRSGGEPIPYSLKWLIVLERQPDGVWKWAYEMWNDNPLPAAAADTGVRQKEHNN
jgi:ketosteroid isomerase-like protein